MSYNLKDGQYNSNSAQQRKSSLANVVKGQDPDIVCLQELGTSTDYSHFKADAFASACNNRSYGSYQQGTSAVMWDSALFTKLANGSVDCTVAEGDGGDGYTRICTWVKLERNADGAIFYVISAHFDLNKPNDSAQTLIDYVADNFTDAPVIVAGDFNANEQSWVNTRRFTNSGYTNANTEYTDFLAANDIRGYSPYSWDERVPYPTAAENGLTPTFSKHGTIIDWCYYIGSGIASSNFTVLTGAGTGPSDHYPIYAKFTFQ